MKTGLFIPPLAGRLRKFKPQSVVSARGASLLPGAAISGLKGKQRRKWFDRHQSKILDITLRETLPLTASAVGADIAVIPKAGRRKKIKCLYIMKDACVKFVGKNLEADQR
jgi:hypothetical protein